MPTYKTKPKSSKWAISTSSYMLDASSVFLLNNAQSPKSISNDSFKLAWEISNGLIRLQHQYRIEHGNGLQSVIRASNREILGFKIVEKPTTPTTRKKMLNMLT